MLSLKKTISIFFCLIIAIFPLSTITTQAIQIDSMDTFYYALAEAVLNFETNIVVETPAKLQSVNLDEVAQRVKEKNQFLAGNIRGATLDTRGNLIYVTMEYNLTKEEYEFVLEKAQNIAKQLDGLSDYEKIKATHDYLVDVFSYNILYPGPYNGFTKGLTACTGYAMAFQAVMDVCNIPCLYVTNSTHAWNVVQVDGNWYNIDVTWDDSEDVLSYDYFLKGNPTFAKNHGIHPLCSNVDYISDLSFEHKIKETFSIPIYAIIAGISIILTIVLIEIIKHKKMKKKQQLYYQEQQLKNRQCHTNTEYLYPPTKNDTNSEKMDAVLNGTTNNKTF